MASGLYSAHQNNSSSPILALEVMRWGTALGMRQINCSRQTVLGISSPKAAKGSSISSHPPNHVTQAVSTTGLKGKYFMSQKIHLNHMKAHMQVAHMTMFLVNFSGTCQSLITPAWMVLLRRGACTYVAVKSLTLELLHQMLRGLLKTT